LKNACFVPPQAQRRLQAASSFRKPVMSNSMLTKKILVYELIGFLTITLVLWVDEVFDLPHNLLGAAATPVNWIESIFESALVLALGAFIIFLSWRFLKQIKYLEGFLPVCSFCKKIRIGKDWAPIEQYIKDHSEAEFSHSLCPECLKKHYGEFF
jgi:hypothetical protein